MSFYQALSGLNASESAINVIGHNIANSTTAGYKSQNAQFSDVYAGARGDNALSSTQIGSGVFVSDVATNFKQGAPISTGGELDMAINGAGFFRMEDAGGKAYYTRNGQFYLDKDGYVRNKTAADTYLTGFEVDDKGNLIGGFPSPLHVGNPTMDPSQTTEAFLRGNFDSRAKAVYADFTLPGPNSVPSTNSYNTATSVNIYDSLGNAHSLNYYFNKTGPNEWTAFMAVDQGANNNVDFKLDGANPSNYLNLQQFQQGETNTLRDFLSKYPKVANAIRDSFPLGDPPTNGGLANFDQLYDDLLQNEPGYNTMTHATGTALLAAYPDMETYLQGIDDPADLTFDDERANIAKLRAHAIDIKFDGNGHMIEPSDPSKIGITITGFQTTTGANGPGEVGQGLPVPGTPVTLPDLTFNLDFSGSTQFAETSNFTKNNADGNTAGDFAGIGVGDNGMVSAKYTNGKTLYLGQVAMATFPSTHGLARLGDNLYGETFNSGQPVVNPAGVGVNGTIVASSIEESNVNLTEELVQMIIQQRSYQANSQTIKTQDTLLQTVINLR